MTFDELLRKNNLYRIWPSYFLRRTLRIKSFERLRTEGSYRGTEVLKGYAALPSGFKTSAVNLGAYQTTTEISLIVGYLMAVSLLLQSH